MNKYVCFLLSSLFFILTSCLKGDLEDLPAYEEAEITGIQKVEYRFYDENDISNVDGQPIVKYVDLGREVTIKDNVVSIVVKVPEASNTFPEAERAKASVDNIAVMAAISTAARLTPIGGAPKLGLPGDWSKPNKYEVKAANGSKKEWTIQVVEFIK